MKEGWIETTIGDVCSFEYGKPLPKSKRDPKGDVAAYGANGIKCRTNEVFWDKPSIIVGRKGSAGEVTLPEDRFWPLDVTYFVDFDPAECDRMYLYHYLVLQKLPHLARGVKPGINRNDVYKLRFPHPPLAEQRRIVAILDEAFAGIDQVVKNTEQNLAAARELFESELNRVFSEGGEGWEEKRLGEVYSIGSSKRIMETEWTDSGVPFYGGKEIVRLAAGGHANSNAFISEEKYREYASKYDMPRAGDLLVTARGTIGVGYIVRTGDRFYYKDGNIISFRSNIPANPSFLLYAFRSNILFDQLSELTGTTVRHLPLSKAKKLRLKIPDLSMQNEVVQQLQDFECETQSLKSRCDQKLAALSELKQSILQKAFAGELT